jgi:hypothetical protein
MNGESNELLEISGTDSLSERHGKRRRIILKIFGSKPGNCYMLREYLVLIIWYVKCQDDTRVSQKVKGLLKKGIFIVNIQKRN